MVGMINPFLKVPGLNKLPYKFIVPGDLQVSKFWILTCSDIFTRYSIAIVCKLLDEHWLTKFEAPETIVLDQGRPYIAKTYKPFLNELGINASYTSAERKNSTILSVLRSYASGNITNVFEIVNKRLNLCFHRILNASPHEMMFGYSYVDPLYRSLIRTEEAKMRTFQSILKNEQAENKARDVNYD
ncbi:hypothetical protein HZS_833 [Henneguya salminicola]|nr:hypothetical protein HZS_833 [Henneguya salminicola]